MSKLSGQDKGHILDGDDMSRVRVWIFSPHSDIDQRPRVANVRRLVSKGSS